MIFREITPKAKGDEVSSKNIKIKIDANTGSFEYEGPESSLESTLSILQKKVGSLSVVAATTERASTNPKAPPQKPSTEKTEAVKSKSKPKGVSYKPKYNADLDLLKLPDFYDGLELRKNTECVVAFLTFLTEELALEEVTGDHLYTCFVELKDRLKVPGSFYDTLRNAQNRAHVIKYEKGYAQISLTPKGSNLYFHDILKRAKSE